MSLIKKTIILLLPLTLVACTPSLSPTPRTATDDYLKQASLSSGTDQAYYQLLACEQLIKSNQLQVAAEILSDINAAALPLVMQHQKALLLAQLDLARGQMSRALTQLNALSETRATMTRANQQQWYVLSAQAAEQLGNTRTLIQASTQAIVLMDNATEAYQAKQRLLYRLIALSTIQRKQIASQTDDVNTAGWLALASLMANHQENTADFISQLHQWQQRYPQHMANVLLPSGMQHPTLYFPESPQKIALLLPLSGPYRAAGHAVRDAFFASYLQAQHLGGPKTNITVIDSAQGNLLAQYQRASQADIVVGPLTKENLNTLVQAGVIQSPTLGLNQIDLRFQAPPSALYLLSLSPALEIEQITARAAERHHTHAVIIAPNNPWGKALAQKTQATFEALGGHIIDQLRYDDPKALNGAIKNLLHITSSEARAHALKKIIRHPLRFLPRRRDDIDCIFLLTTPDIGRQIKPLLNYYFAGNLPLYAASSIYQGSPQPQLDRDLNGISFLDIPWVQPKPLGQQTLNTLRQALHTTYPKAMKTQNKLFALGVDAYTLTQQLNTLYMLSTIGLPGATGTLFVNPSTHVIEHQLPWYVFRAGQPQRD
jgi:outer membrane PBP1 activator LpoA protein